MNAIGVVPAERTSAPGRAQPVEAASSVSTGWGDNFERCVTEFFPSGMGNYVAPTKREQAGFKLLVAATQQALREKDSKLLRRASLYASLLGYEIKAMPSERGQFLQLAERGEPTRGWGTVLFNTKQGSDLIIEIPHPAFDIATPELGWRAFQAFNADVLILAGAERKNRTELSPDVEHRPDLPKYSISDMTHVRDSIFQAAHEAVTGPHSTVLQLHGFKARPHHEKFPDFPADQQFVLTDAANDGYDPPKLLAAQDALAKAGYKSHICTFENEAMSELGGLPNVQHKEMEERGLVGPGRHAEFIHIEMEKSLRRDNVREVHFARMLEALKPVFAPSASSTQVAASMVSGPVGQAIAAVPLDVNAGVTCNANTAGRTTSEAIMQVPTPSVMRTPKENIP